MTTEHPVGTVAMVTALNRRTPYRAFFDGQTWREVGPGSCFCVDTPETIRPLVVLDVQHENGWSHAIRALRMQTSSAVLWDLADQIEVQTVPPKPAEPTGLGAVVEDADGGRYVRLAGDDADPWASMPVDERQILSLSWAEFTAVRVLSEGVPS